jgi:putative ABC transport system permease protein
LSQVSPGFDPSNTIAFQISSSWGETSDLKANRARTTTLVEALHAIPGVQSAAVTIGLPGIPNEYQVELKSVEGRADTEPRIVSRGRLVTPQYFATVGIPVVAGELCTPEREGYRSMMVNRVFANRFFDGAANPTSVIGRQLIALPQSSGSVPVTITGIVGDARETGVHREPPPVAYWCNGFLQPSAHFLVRSASTGAVTPEAIRRKLRELEPFRSAFNFIPLAEHISDAYAENRLRTVLLAFFACTALALASVGLYGTLSYLVQIRQREVAVRMALGALRSQVLRHFLAQGLQMAAIGCIAGMALALASGRTLSGMLFGITATDKVTLGGVVITVLAVAVFASLLPAARAARVEPMRALREE